MSLEELEKQLYSKKAVASKKKKSVKPEAETAAKKKKDESLSETWSTVPSVPSVLSPARKSGHLWTYFIVGISTAALLLGGWLIFDHFYSTGAKIALELATPDKVRLGAPFEATVGISNQSDVVLEEAVLIINLYGGLAAAGNGPLQVSLGEIGFEDLAQKRFRLLAVASNDGDPARLEAVLSYRIGNGRFERKTEKTFVNLSPAIRAEAASPGQVLSGSNFEVTVSYLNESDYDFPDLVFEAVWPDDFKFNSGRPEPIGGNNLWQVGGLPPGSRGSFSFSGFVTAPAQSFFDIPIAIRAVLEGQEYDLGIISASFSVAPSPLALDIFINNSENYVARLGDRLHYVVRYRNNSGVALVDAAVRVKLKGELFNVASLETVADIDTVSNVLTWNPSNVPGLKTLSPGTGGEVSFDVRLLPEFPIRRLSDKDFSLIAEATMDSPTVPYYFKAAKTSAVREVETKVIGRTEVDAQAFYRDAPSGIINEGPLPPKTEKSTQYTVHWVIKNYATDVRNIVVRSVLRSGVSWTGAVRSNVGTVPIFDERTGEIIWQIDRLAAGRGVISEAAEAIFQIQAIPNITQIGQYQPLIGETRLQAVDDFTGLPLENSDAALTTALSDDLTVGPLGGRVVQ